jgi:hypothetical protein
VTVRSSDKEMRVITGPAYWQHGPWLLPVWLSFDTDNALAEIEREAAKLRKAWGVESRSSV